uniref:tyrosine-protein kinase Src42A-like n=1 Tax=Pristiophorus japonicus TaxID=55135 RepID=UPI00398EE713
MGRPNKMPRLNNVDRDKVGSCRQQQCSGCRPVQNESCTTKALQKTAETGSKIKLAKTMIPSKNGSSQAKAEDLLIKEGEQIEVLRKEGEWTLVRKLEANEEQVVEGFVPSSFVAQVGSVAAAPWFFGSMIHIDAKRYLLRDENQNGSFLVWQNKEMNDIYFLSALGSTGIVQGKERKEFLKCVQENFLDQCIFSPLRMEAVLDLVLGIEVGQVRYGDIVKSYRIHGDTSFHSLSQLINRYSEEADHLCTRLSEPCIKLDRPSICTLAHVAEWEIQHSSLQKVKLIGSGQCGEVWEGIWNGTTEVAIKELKGVGSQLKNELLKEAEIMKQLCHERLVKLLAVCTESEPFYIVTELMTLGNLKKYLKSHSETRSLEFSLLSGFAIQIAEGMAYLEEKCYIHRDLRTENILLTEMLSCKIADFGLARLLENGQRKLSYDAKVPIKWMAPEIFIDYIYTIKSDVWSFGILLTEIVTYGEIPFPGKGNADFVADMMDGIIISPPAGCPDSLRDIMLQCWKQESEKRPTFKQLQDMLMKCNPVPVTEELCA